MERAAPWDRALRASLILFAVAAPWSIAAAQTAIVLTALLVLVRSLTTRARARGPAVPWTVILFGVYLAVQALAIPLGVHPDHSLSVYRGSWVLLFPFVFWPALQEAYARRAAVVALVVSGALAGVYGVVQHFQGRDWLHGGRVLEYFVGGGYISVGNLSSHLTYSGVMLPVLFVAVGIALDTSGRRRAAAALAAIVIGLAVLFSFARTAWMGAAAGLVWLSFGRGWRRGLLFTLPALVIAAVGAALEPAISARLASILDVTELPRWRLWQTALHIIADHPLLGAGPGSFPALFPTYKVPGDYLSTIHPHNDLLNAMVETGIVGGIAWVGIWLTFLRETHGPRCARTAWTVRAARAGVVALLVAGLGQCFSTDEEVAQVWFFLLTATLIEAGVDTRGGRAPAKRIEKWLKARSLPLARRLFARRTGRGGTRAPDSLEGRRRPGGTPARILVLRPDDRLGNLLLMTPFLERLREAHPGATIGMLVGGLFAPLLCAWPWVDTWIVQDKRAHIRGPWRFGSWIAEMRRGGWERAYEMSNHDTHSYYSCLLTLASGAAERIGFDEPRNQSTLTRAVPAPSPTRHFSLAPLELLRTLGHAAEPSSMACPLPPGEPAERGLAVGAEYLVVHVGGRGGKALPAVMWREILTRTAETFPGRLVVIAGPGEEDRVPRVDAVSDRILVAPRMDIVALARLIAGSRGYVGNDTGVMHLAVALRKPTVALFFRSNPYHYAPLGEDHATVLLANPYDVDASVWATGDAGVARSRLYTTETDPDASRAGIPATGLHAIETIASAISATAGMHGAALTRNE